MGGVLCVGIVATFAAEYPALMQKKQKIKPEYFYSKNLWTNLSHKSLNVIGVR